MKAFVVAAALLAASVLQLSAQEISDEEGAKIVKEVEMLMEAFNKGDVDGLLKKTHPAIYKIAGGQEGFDKALRQGAKQIIDLGITFDSLKVQAPTTSYKSGEDIVCFVPKSAVMTVNGQKVKSESFMIAARKGSGEWLYLDGAGLRKNPELLKMFFPDLPDDVKLPTNTVEVVK